MIGAGKDDQVELGNETEVETDPRLTRMERTTTPPSGNQSGQLRSPADGDANGGEPWKDPEAAEAKEDVVSPNDGNRMLNLMEPDELKKLMTQALAKKRYDVKDNYKVNGIPQKIARHNWFEYI